MKRLGNIKPDLSIVIRHERPPVTVSKYKISFTSYFYPLIRLYREIEQKIQFKRLGKLIDLVKKSENRAELEKAIGKPIYAMNGSGYEVTSPNGEKYTHERVEVYEYNNIIIELWFKDNKVKNLSGFVKRTSWDAALDCVKKKV